MTQKTHPEKEMAIKKAHDYNLFKKLEGNRPVNEAHVRKLMLSMRKKDLQVPIMVNPNMEVIDGQHRLEARKRLILPVYYFIGGEYGLQEVQALNTQNKKWNVEDYLQSNLQLGNKEYEVYQWFRKKYGFDHSVSLQLLSGDFRGKEQHDAFNLGLFRANKFQEAKATAEMLIQIEPFYKNFRRRSFVKAILKVLDLKVFDFKKFLQKLEIQPTALKDCATWEQYLDLIEEIFNYRSQTKVSLKYGD